VSARVPLAAAAWKSAEPSIGRAERNPSKKIAILELGGFRYRLATGRIRVTRILREAQLDHSRRRRLLLSLSFLRPITLSAPTCCHKAARTTRSFNTSATSWTSPRHVKRQGRGDVSSFSTSICSPKNSSIYLATLLTTTGCCCLQRRKNVFDRQG